MSDRSRERIEFVKDVWADVLATAGFLAVSGLGALGHHFLGHFGLWTELPVRAIEVGGAIGAVDHVARMVWHRTFVGQVARAFWHLLRKRRDRAKNPEKRDDDDDTPAPRRALPPGTPTPPGGSGEGGGGTLYASTILLHPPLGQFKSRLFGSAFVALIAAVFYTLWTLGTRTSTGSDWSWQSQLALVAGFVVIQPVATTIFHLFPPKKRAGEDPEHREPE